MTARKLSPHCILTYLRGRKNPASLAVIAAAVGGSVFSVSFHLRSLETQSLVSRPKRGQYEVTAEGQVNDYTEIRMKGKNCPTTKGTYPKRSKANRYFGPTKSPYTLEERIEMIGRRGATLAPATD